MKNKIKVSDALIKSEKCSENSRIFCDEIQYIADKSEVYFDHHLMFRKGKKLVFKMWLPNSEEDKPFKDVNEAIKKIGIRILK